MKKHTKPTPREGYLARAVRTFYSDLKNIKHDDPNLKSAIKLGKRCYEDMMKKEKTCEIETQPSKTKYRKTGGGRKVTIPDVRQALFEWFIDVRSSLKGRFPMKMFKMQCHMLYDQWSAQQPEEIPEEKKLFSRRFG